jgi:hypothetical protein
LLDRMPFVLYLIAEILSPRASAAAIVVAAFFVVPLVPIEPAGLEPPEGADPFDGELPDDEPLPAGGDVCELDDCPPEAV